MSLSISSIFVPLHARSGTAAGGGGRSRAQPVQALFGGAAAGARTSGVRSAALKLRRRRNVVVTAASMAPPPPAIQLPTEEAAPRELLEEQLRGTVAAAARENLVPVNGLSPDVPLGVRVRLGDSVRGFLLQRLDGLSFVLVTEGDASSVVEGALAEVERTFAVVEPSEGLLGRTIEAQTIISYAEKGPSSWEIPGRAVMADIKGVTTRTPINRSLHTGVAAVDILAPVGCGQCMLLVGEKGSGKSALLAEAVNTAARKGVRCVYAAIGSGAPALPAIEAALKEGGGAPLTTIVTARPNGSCAERHAALCVALAVAEGWRDAGVDALIVVDDCGASVDFWSSMQALARATAPPAGSAQAAANEAGEEEKDNDPEKMVEMDGMLISAAAANRRRFLANFLQRCANLNEKEGGGSLTLIGAMASAPGAYAFGAGTAASAAAAALSARKQTSAYANLSPEQRAKLLAAIEKKAAEAKEKEAAELAAAGPLVVSRPVIEEFMSVADGQIFLQRRPAGAAAGWLVSPRDSISRIGLDAASPALRTLGCIQLRLDLAQADDSSVFAGQAGGAAAKEQARAERLRALLCQQLGQPRSLSEQVVMLLALRHPVSDAVAPEAMNAALAEVLAGVRANAEAAAALDEVEKTGKLAASASAAINKALDGVRIGGGGKK